MTVSQDSAGEAPCLRPLEGGRPVSLSDCRPVRAVHLSMMPQTLKLLYIMQQCGCEFSDPTQQGFPNALTIKFTLECCDERFLQEHGFFAMVYSNVTQLLVFACSPSCELAARRLASRLGSAEATMARFAAGTQQSKRPALKKVDEAASTYAAGADDNPIMLAQVKVCYEEFLASQLDLTPEIGSPAAVLYPVLVIQTHWGMQSQFLQAPPPDFSRSLSCEEAHTNAPKHQRGYILRHCWNEL